MQKRIRKFLYPEVQIRVVLISLGVASLVLLINFLLAASTVSRVSVEAARGLPGNLLIEELRSSLLRMFLISIGCAIPLAAAFGVFYSFRFAGPLYKFRKFFGELKSGRWGDNCRLRSGDDLHDLCHVINDALEQMRLSLRETHQSLQRLSVQVAGGTGPGDQAPCRAEELRDSVAGIKGALEVRFPFLATAAPQAPAAEKPVAAVVDLQA